MKRTMWGSLILLVLLIGGLVVSFGMRAVHSDICRLLQQAEAAAEGDDWQNAASLAKEARLAWEKHHAFTASFATSATRESTDSPRSSHARRSQRKSILTAISASCLNPTDTPPSLIAARDPSWHSSTSPISASDARHTVTIPISDLSRLSLQRVPLSRKAS